MHTKENYWTNVFSKGIKLIDNITWRKQSFIIFGNKTKTKLNSYIKGLVALFFLIAFTTILTGCKQETKATDPEYSSIPPTQKTPVYHFAIHPLYNPARLIHLYQPLIDYLNNHLNGAQIVLEASRDYSNFEKKYENRAPEFLLPNPWQTLQAIKLGYTVIAMAGDSKDFKGIFIVRKDSNIHEPTDLKGKVVNYPSSTALAACIMPQYFLQKKGVDVNKEIINIYVGSQESSIMNVYLKTTAAGATWPPPWRDFQKEHPNEASQMKVIWETESLVNNSVMVRNDIPLDIKNQVKKYLLELDKTPEGKKILKNIETDYLKLATNKDYDVVQVYTDRFEKEIRKIDIK